MKSTPCPLCPRHYHRAGHLARHISMAHSGEEPGPGDGPGKLTTIIDSSDDDTDSEENSEMESNFDANSDDDSAAPKLNENSDIEQSTTVYPTNSGQILRRVLGYRDHLKDDWKPWAPFTDAAEWRLARFFVEHKLTATSINAYFNQGLHKTLKCERSFQSAYTFQKQLDKMPRAPPNFQYGTVGDGFG
ncbi:hypothetical protein DFP73DRAFT_532521 [Morchella snyderi]|nr:hypothetical protein DFP73DRAFT_532521 [Morchella snyderi]